MTYWVVLPAAGSGSRYGGAKPKQYEPLAGTTVLEQSLAAFLAAAEQTGPRGIVVALAPDDDRFSLLRIAADPRVSTTVGGATRAASVLAGLRAVAARGAGDEDWVLVHDAARPCLSALEVAALLDALATPEGASDGALLALPFADTVKRGSDGMGPARVVATVPREQLWRALTPQAFRLGVLRPALEQALAGQEGRLAPTDESAAVEALGYVPVLVPGSPYNIKVTLPADLAFAAMVLRAREEGGLHVRD